MKSSIFMHCCLLMSIVGIATIGVSVAVQSFRPASDPFSMFADVFPGQPESAAESRGFVCPNKKYDFYHDSSENECILQPEAGIFSMIRVVVSGGMIRQIRFTLRDHNLKVGDLALLLGTGNFRATPHTIFFSWQGMAGFASTTGRRFSLFNPVWMVTFTDTPLPA